MLRVLLARGLELPFEADDSPLLLDQVRFPRRGRPLDPLQTGPNQVLLHSSGPCLFEVKSTEEKIVNRKLQDQVEVCQELFRYLSEKEKKRWNSFSFLWYGWRRLSFRSLCEILSKC